MNVSTENAENKIAATARKSHGTMRIILRNYQYYLMIIPGLVAFFIFQYIPMYGITVAFREFRFDTGIFAMPWDGWNNFAFFKRFFMWHNFWDLIRNTLVISGLKLILGFPVPIIFALMLNEVRNLTFKRVVQTISYLPHFISWVVVLTILNQFLSMDGLVNQVRRASDLDPIFYINLKRFFYPMVYFTAVWKNMGYSAIIYVAALAGVNPELYEAAIVDGAKKLRRIWHISLPSILPTIAILFILRFSAVLKAGWDQIYLMRMPGNIARSQILDTYVIDVGLEGGQFGNATAVSLFQSVIGLILVLIVNKIARKVADVGLF